MTKPTPSKKPKVQMADLARMAGVSTATVSRALNGSTLINEETRTRILELAKSLNYVINQGAQSLRRRENRTIAVVIPYLRQTRQLITDPFFLAMLGSLGDALTDRGYEMLLSRVDADRIDEVASLYDTGRAAGLIVIGQWGHHEDLNALSVRGVPMVVWGAQLDRQLYCSVGSDNQQGGDLATTHLLSQGRRQVAFMGNLDMPEVALRHQGYLAAHQRMGQVPDSRLHIRSGFTPEAAQAAMHGFLDLNLSFDAVFCASDLMALNAIGVMTGRGLTVPGSVAVVGFDDTELAAHSFPPLTTVHQPIDIAGKRMVDALLSLMSGDKVESVSLIPTLAVRASSV